MLGGGQGRFAPPAQAFICPSWAQTVPLSSGERGPVQQPSPASHPAQAGVAKARGRHRHKPRTALSCGRRWLFSAGSPVTSPGRPPGNREGGILQNRKRWLGNPASQGPGPWPGPPAPGIVLSTTDQDFMAQKPPEGKG